MVPLINKYTIQEQDKSSTISKEAWSIYFNPDKIAIAISKILNKNITYTYQLNKEIFEQLMYRLSCINYPNISLIVSKFYEIKNAIAAQEYNVKSQTATEEQDEAERKKAEDKIGEDKINEIIEEISSDDSSDSTEEKEKEKTSIKDTAATIIDSADKGDTTISEGVDNATREQSEGNNAEDKEANVFCISNEACTDNSISCDGNAACTSGDTDSSVTVCDGNVNFIGEDGEVIGCTNNNTIGTPENNGYCMMDMRCMADQPNVKNCINDMEHCNVDFWQNTDTHGTCSNNIDCSSGDVQHCSYDNQPTSCLSIIEEKEETNNPTSNTSGTGTSCTGNSNCNSNDVQLDGVILTCNSNENFNPTTEKEEEATSKGCGGDWSEWSNWNYSDDDNSRDKPETCNPDNPNVCTGCDGGDWSCKADGCSGVCCVSDLCSNDFHCGDDNAAGCGSNSSGSGSNSSGSGSNSSGSGSNSSGSGSNSSGSGPGFGDL